MHQFVIKALYFSILLHDIFLHALSCVCCYFASISDCKIIFISFMQTCTSRKYVCYVLFGINYLLYLQEIKHPLFEKQTGETHKNVLPFLSSVQKVTFAYPYANPDENRGNYHLTVSPSFASCEKTTKHNFMGNFAFHSRTYFSLTDKPKMIFWVNSYISCYILFFIFIQ